MHRPRKKDYFEFLWAFWNPTSEYLSPLSFSFTSFLCLLYGVSAIQNTSPQRHFILFLCLFSYFAWVSEDNVSAKQVGICAKCSHFVHFIFFPVYVKEGKRWEWGELGKAIGLSYLSPAQLYVRLHFFLPLKTFLAGYTIPIRCEVETETQGLLTWDIISSIQIAPDDLNPSHTGC